MGNFHQAKRPIFPIKRSVTYQAKRPHLSHQAKRYPSILSKGTKGY